MKKKLLAILGVSALTVAPSMAAGPTYAEISTAITDAGTAATALGGAGLGLLGIFIGFKLVRRAARSLT